MKLILKIVLLFALFINLKTVIAAPAEDEHLAYAKWVPMARQVAQSYIPGAAFVDFLYIGCKAQSASITDYIYKYRMKRDTREFGVYVTVTVDRNKNKALKTFAEKADGAIPSYDKWRDHAVKAVQSHFTGATVIDYRPFGCTPLSPNRANQSFRFWILHHDKQVFIEATITYEAATEKVLNVDFKRTNMHY